MTRLAQLFRTSIATSASRYGILASGLRDEAKFSDTHKSNTGNLDLRLSVFTGLTLATLNHLDEGS
ncbi:hypothetical protein D8B26_000835 [Coccidioides posadasii str. Silveira]|uniref:uncharacterized protein n=1 Tax=Coccidioides posadasii (strain RMSCC 757 / Silveira) TaxID=443226 RepID=UPI001BEE66DC|nr:hypothetical protein D8B26_000835 [Coccidioides posadasii str. Silveira]